MSQKLENQLNLALDTPESMRAETQNLNVGFDADTRTWELIVRYHRDPEILKSDKVITEPLLAGYAIVTVPENMVTAVMADPGVEYVEKPKNFYYGAEVPSARSCLAEVIAGEPFLSGKGVLVAVLDSGIAYRRAEFRKADGGTRIRCLWDQTLTGGGLPGPPAGFLQGAEFSEERINRALSALSAEAGFSLVPSIDATGHGTAVAGIAAAGGTETYRGIAAQADLLIVKLGGGTKEDLAGFTKTTEIMRAVTYAVRKAQDFAMPLVINLSYGNTYGAHDGSSLLESFLDLAAQIGRTCILAGSGNEGNSSGHIGGDIRKRRTADLVVAEYERNLSVQIWKQYTDVFKVLLRAPGGSPVALMPQSGSGGGYILQLEGTEILVYYGEPSPYSLDQEIYLEMLPAGGRSFLTSGIWRFTLEPVRITAGRYDFYLPPAVVRNGGTKFLEASPEKTVTIPGTAKKAITVGAYDPVYEAYADFSGRGTGGFSEDGRIPPAFVKPDVAAPGIGILAPDAFGGYVSVSGTSFAAPIVSGSAALLMEWGIVRGNDPYLYGEKMKAYLRAGAQPLRGEDLYPNGKVGFGAVCAAISLPGS